MEGAQRGGGRGRGQIKSNRGRGYRRASEAPSGSSVASTTGDDEGATGLDFLSAMYAHLRVASASGAPVPGTSTSSGYSGDFDKKKEAEPEKKKETEPEKKNETEPEKKKGAEPEKKKEAGPQTKKEAEPEIKKEAEPQKKKVEPEKKKSEEPEKKKSAEPEKEKRTDPAKNPKVHEVTKSLEKLSIDPGTSKAHDKKKKTHSQDVPREEPSSSSACLSTASNPPPPSESKEESIILRLPKNFPGGIDEKGEVWVQCPNKQNHKHKLENAFDVASLTRCRCDYEISKRVLAYRERHGYAEIFESDLLRHAKNTFSKEEVESALNLERYPLPRNVYMQEYGHLFGKVEWNRRLKEKAERERRGPWSGGRGRPGKRTETPKPPETEEPETGEGKGSGRGRGRGRGKRNN